LKLKIPPELENFDPEAFQRSQAQPDPVIASCPTPSPEVANPWLAAAPVTPPAQQAFVNPWNSAPEPVVAAVAPEPPPAQVPSVNPWNPAPEAPTEQSFSPPPVAVDEPHQLVLNPSDVQFSPLFEQPLSYNPFTPAQPSWKIPRWLMAAAGIFFGSAAILMITLFVVLLRDPKPAPPTVQLVVPTAPVATVTPTPPPAPAAPVAQKAPVQAEAPALPHRVAVAVSRHPAFVRRPSYGSRRSARESEGSPVASEETPTPRSKPPQDELDKLLGQSSL
jgi:hypothetical protein